MRSLFYLAVLAPLMMFISVPAQAVTWVIDQEDSRVIFKYNYGVDQYEGEFKNVEAIFEIDPLSPGSCKFSVTIPIEYLSIDSPEAKDYLLDYEHFDGDLWPTATFNA